MPYATLDELKLVHGPEISVVLDRDGDGSEDNGLADRVLADASAEIDTIIGRRYPVPVSGAPYLKAACCELARYRLYDFAVPEEAEKRYQNTIRRLEAIAKGNADLHNDSGEPIKDKVATGVAPGAEFRTVGRTTFTDESLSGFVGR